MSTTHVLFDIKRSEEKIVMYSIASGEFSEDLSSEEIGIVEVNIKSRSVHFSPRGPWEKYGRKISEEIEGLISGPVGMPIADEFLKLSSWIVRIVARIRHDLESYW